MARGYLLDTHTLYWFAAGDARLSNAAQQALGAGAEPLIVSAASIWEMALALARGRWPGVQAFFPDAATRLRGLGFEVLPIEARHAELSTTLPRIHVDPFDRLLVATARIEDLVLVTGDATVQRYPVGWLW